MNLPTKSIQTVAICSLLLIPGCKPNELTEMEKEQIGTIMQFGLINMSSEDRRLFNELEKDHLQRLEFLRDLATKQKEEALRSGNMPKYQTLVKMLELISTYNMAYLSRAIHYNTISPEASKRYMSR